MSAMIVIGRGKGDRRGELTVDPLCFPGAFFCISLCSFCIESIFASRRRDWSVFVLIWIIGLMFALGLI